MDKNLDSGDNSAGADSVDQAGATAAPEGTGVPVAVPETAAALAGCGRRRPACPAGRA